MFWSKSEVYSQDIRYSQMRFFFWILFCLPLWALGQTDSLENSLNFEGDFRFRIEEDWNVRKPDGTYMADRSRLRYRARAGLTYKHKHWSEFGMRLRTGDPKKQQDPQITIGDEFSGIPISFEKAYAAFNHSWFSAWLGKNTFPFEKQNELFWSDNVFPEGVALEGSFAPRNGIVDRLSIKAAHFIFITNGSGFDQDSYIQGLQLLTHWWQQRLVLFPSFYYFNQMPNIPDGNETFRLNYAIIHLGGRFQPIKNVNWSFEFDYYQNLEDLAKNDSISPAFVDQKKGLTVSTNYGDLKEKGHWFFQVSYNYQERYSAVDFLAQNDWARWDYSAQGSPDGRLTNYKGWEFLVAYALTKKMDIQLRSFFVEQLLPLGDFKETNSRVRLDLNIRI